MHKNIVALATVLLIVVTPRIAFTDTASYFPQGALNSSSAKSDSFDNGWYSNHLRAMSEPVLSPASGSRTYRFTWLRTFHHPVAVRVVASENHAKLVATELNGAGGYYPGEVLRRKTVNLTLEQFKKLESLIEQSGFWNLAAREETVGLDGSQWVVEGATDKYHVVVRWSPQSGPVREIGEQFLSFTGWQYKPKEFY